jgi:predicted transcriptional regulator
MRPCTQGKHRVLHALTKSSKRSKSFLAAEAISDYVESEESQLQEIREALAQAENGHVVKHEKVVEWLKSWGKPNERKAPLK